MESSDLTEWIERCSQHSSVWYIKRFSGNDTLANGANQSGPYIPKAVLFRAFPQLNQKHRLNPDVRFSLAIDSHSEERMVRATWYNNRFHGGTRNETRFTGLGGVRSAILDPENTGAVVIFVFVAFGTTTSCKAWVCRTANEEATVEDYFGPIEPGLGTVYLPHPSDECPQSLSLLGQPRDCWLQPHELPSAWLTRFPKGAEIASKAVKMRPEANRSPDVRLLRRRECEYQLYRSIEDAVELPILRGGFASVDEFARHANSFMQRRKVRSGQSLEIHTRMILEEEGLKEGIDFSHQPETEDGKRPDFVFPSQSAYQDPTFSDGQLSMLAVKTTCRDRWRQILNEADRIGQKHLLTLQEGVSERQFREMSLAGVQLVVPAPLIRKYPKRIRTEIQSFGSFVELVSPKDRR